MPRLPAARRVSVMRRPRALQARSAPRVRACHVDHPDLDHEPRLRHHGDDRHHRARRCFRTRACSVEQMPDVSLPFVIDRHALPGRRARGRRDRRDQAGRVRGEPVAGRRRRSGRTRSKGRARCSSEFRLVTDMTQRDAGRARQDRAGAPGLPQATSRTRSSSAPTTRTSQPVVSLAVTSRTTACANSRRSPTRRSSRASRTFRAWRASTSTAA